MGTTVWSTLTVRLAGVVPLAGVTFTKTIPVVDPGGATAMALKSTMPLPAPAS